MNDNSEIKIGEEKKYINLKYKFVNYKKIYGFYIFLWIMGWLVFFWRMSQGMGWRLGFRLWIFYGTYFYSL